MASADEWRCYIGSMALRFVGRTLISLGLMILVFLAYQLFGTNIVTDRTQQALASEVKREWAEPPEPDISPRARPQLGDGVAIIEIPKIGVDHVVVEGVGVEDLKKGPGHYPKTSMPGELGNVVISGHRTTYGAPFYRLDELQVGDEIRLTDREGVYVYYVSERKVVLPTDVSVIAPFTDARLTLTTCEPRFSAKKRLIIVAMLKGEPKEPSGG